MRRDFLEEVDQCLKEAGYSERSRFIRDAVIEKLARMGHLIPAAHAAAPARVRLTSAYDAQVVGSATDGPSEGAGRAPSRTFNYDPVADAEARALAQAKEIITGAAALTPEPSAPKPAPTSPSPRKKAWRSRP